MLVSQKDFWYVGKSVKQNSFTLYMCHILSKDRVIIQCRYGFHRLPHFVMDYISCSFCFSASSVSFCYGAYFLLLLFLKVFWFAWNCHPHTTPTRYDIEGYTNCQERNPGEHGWNIGLYLQAGQIQNSCLLFVMDHLIEMHQLARPKC